MTRLSARYSALCPRSATRCPAATRCRCSGRCWCSTSRSLTPSPPSYRHTSPRLYLTSRGGSTGKCERRREGDAGEEEEEEEKAAGEEKGEEKGEEETEEPSRWSSGSSCTSSFSPAAWTLASPPRSLPPPTALPSPPSASLPPLVTLALSWRRWGARWSSWGSLQSRLPSQTLTLATPSTWSFLNAPPSRRSLPGRPAPPLAGSSSSRLPTTATARASGEAGGCRATLASSSGSWKRWAMLSCRCRASNGTRSRATALTPCGSTSFRAWTCKFEKIARGSCGEWKRLLEEVHIRPECSGANGVGPGYRYRHY
mmetsp:Transcript_40430/g.96147  ORF Transcript_40430/g.96147 Transcript_40430/m.96147 type:complete len:313 (+) Transcript_40430:415-1353(+)